MLKQETLTPLPVPTTVCRNCGVEEHHLLLPIPHRDGFRRLCTSCVLRLHLQYFCPTCFAFYGSSPPPGPEFIHCKTCYSASHSHCAAPTTMAPHYTCPLCVNPNSLIFVPKKASDGRRVIDQKAAAVLFTAARIAATAMEKAAECAKAEAEKRAEEAAVTRKIANEALEHVAFLEAKERLERLQIISAAEASGYGNSYCVAKNEPPFLGPIAAPLSVSGAAVAMDEKERMRVFPAQNCSGLYSAPPAAVDIPHLMDYSHVKEENIFFPDDEGSVWYY